MLYCINMRRLNISIHTTLVTLSIILCSWKGSATGYQPQETNGSRSLRAGDGTPPHASTKDPEHENNNYHYDGESSVSTSPLPDHSTEEERVGKVTLKLSSSYELAIPSNSTLDRNLPGLTLLAMGPTVYVALHGDKHGTIEDGLQQATHDKSADGVIHSDSSNPKSVSNFGDGPGSQGANSQDGIHAYRNSKTVSNFGDGPNPQAANSSDGVIHSDSSDPETFSNSKDGSYVQLDASSRDTIVMDLPEKLRTRIAITDHYNRKLLEGYVNASKKLPNDIESNLRDYHRSRLMERITLRKLIDRAKLEATTAAASRLITDYMAVRNGVVGDEVWLNPDFRSFFENVSPARTAYENVKRSEVESMDEYLVDDDSGRSTAAGKGNVHDDVRSGHSETADEKRITVVPAVEGDRTPGLLVKRLVKRDADDESSADVMKQEDEIYKYKGSRSKDVDEEDEEARRIQFNAIIDTPDDRKQAGKAYNGESARSEDVAVKDEEDKEDKGDEEVRVEFNAIDTPDEKNQAAMVDNYEGSRSEDVDVKDKEARFEFNAIDTPDDKKQASNVNNYEGARSEEVAVKNKEDEEVRVEFNAIDTPDDKKQADKVNNDENARSEDVAVKDEEDKEDKGDERARIEFNAIDTPDDKKQSDKIDKYEGAKSEDVAVKDKEDKDNEEDEEVRVEFNAIDTPDDKNQAAVVDNYEGSRSEDVAVKNEENEEARVGDVAVKNEEDKEVRVEFNAIDTPDDRNQAAKVYNDENARSEDVAVKNEENEEARVGDVAVKDEEDKEVRVEFNAIDTPDDKKQAGKVYNYEGSRSKDVDVKDKEDEDVAVKDKGDEDVDVKDKEDEEVRVEFNANDTPDVSAATTTEFTGSTTEHATKSPSLILPLALIIFSVIELILVTLFVCKDRIFKKPAKTVAPHSAVAPGKPGAPDAHGKPDATATAPHAAAKTVVTTTTATKKDTDQKAKK